MEKGYFHKDRGYWQTMGDVPLDHPHFLPEGTVEVPLKPGPDYRWNTENMEWVKAPAPAPDVQAVKDECLRRRKLLAGLSENEPVSQLDYFRQNNIEEEMELFNIQRERTWTEAEAARFKKLQHLRLRLKAVTIRSNEIQVRLSEFLEQIPALDITDDRLWDTSEALSEVIPKLS